MEDSGQPARREASFADMLSGWKIDQLDFPTFRLTLIAKIMDRLTIRYLAVAGDISYAEWRVMARLAAMPEGGSIGLIAELAWVDRAEVSRAVASLEGEGLTSRRSNSLDRRIPVVFLTEKGWLRYRSTLRERIAFHEMLLTELSPAECRELDRLLAKISPSLMRLFRADPAESLTELV